MYKKKFWGKRRGGGGNKEFFLQNYTPKALFGKKLKKNYNKKTFGEERGGGGGGIRNFSNKIDPQKPSMNTAE